MRGVGRKAVLLLEGRIEFRFTFSHCLMLSVNAILKRYLSVENGFKVMIPNVWCVVGFSFMKYCWSLSRSAGHQQHAIGLNTVNVNFKLLKIAAEQLSRNCQSD